MPRMIRHPILSIQLDNPVLTRLLEEQLAAHKFTVVSPDTPSPDCILIPQGGSPLLASADTRILEIPKGAVRLGDILDKLHYLLSGRNNHLENDMAPIPLGPFTLFPADNKLLHMASQEEIRLTDKERFLLRVLYNAGDAGLSRRDILKLVWGYADDAETHTIETHIYRLRQKLEPYHGQNLITAADGRYLITF